MKNMLSIKPSEIIRLRIEGMQIGLLEADDISVAPEDPRFEKHLEDLIRYLQEKFPDKRPSADDVVGHVRRMYRRIGWEPTQYRPSSEALVRRLLKGKGLYRINILVDYGNLVSARYFLPMGLYDREQISGKITVDVGGEKEYYDGITRDGIRAEGKMILRDEKGIFGNPTADSRRTSITKNTRSALALFFCPPEVGQDYIEQTLHALGSHYQRFSEHEVCKSIIRF
jgi:DNA/RNA-binding domain of Phe-tRNA-synthetase-like protein